jgi:ABC-type nickel/cobalt efflux system permease component RcnA
LLIVAFSVGLAAVLMAVAILFVTARRAFDRLPLDAGHLRLVGVLSAAFVTVFGAALAIRSLLEGHLFSV